MAADDICRLVTVGRRTGRPHEIEIWYERVADTLYLLAGGGRSTDWVANLAANPAAEVLLEGERFGAVGRLLDASEDGAEARRARDLVFAKYEPRYDGSLDDWRERALPVAVDLHERLD